MHGSCCKHPSLALLTPDLIISPKTSAVSIQRNLALHTATQVECKGQCWYNYFTSTKSLCCYSFQGISHTFLWESGLSALWFFPRDRVMVLLEH